MDMFHRRVIRVMEDIDINNIAHLITWLNPPPDDIDISDTSDMPDLVLAMDNT